LVFNGNFDFDATGRLFIKGAGVERSQALPRTMVKSMIDEDYLKDSEIIIQKLMKIPAMRALEKRHLQSLLEMSEIKVFEPGEQILEEGQFERSIFYLISGKARIITGDVFGEMGVIDGSARSASVFAIDKTVCLQTDMSTVESLYGDSKLAFRYTIFRGFAQILATRLRMTSEELLRSREQLSQKK
jgi:CRP/FNR family transcriptional regulator, cyclic AMP receptor protein